MVLVGLDRRDDVAHPLVAGPVELLEQEVVYEARVGERAVERLVADPEEPPALSPEAPPKRDAVWLPRRCGVEGPRGRGLPVDDERAAIVVVHPAAADVGALGRPLAIDPAEAEPALGVLEGAQAAAGPALDRLRRDLRRTGFGGLQEDLAHAVEAVVGLVDVGLLGGQLRMRHRLASLCPGVTHMSFTYNGRR